MAKTDTIFTEAQLQKAFEIGFRAGVGVTTEAVHSAAEVPKFIRATPPMEVFKIIDWSKVLESILGDAS